MTKNKRTHNKHTPFLLIVNAKAYGAYENLETASAIGHATGLHYQIRNLRGDIVDSND